MSAAGQKYIEDMYPLSPMQEMILFQSLYAPASGIYIAQIGCRLTGLDVPAFKAAWQLVMGRHPILRTAFAWKNAPKPLQLVGRRVGLPLYQEDCRAMTGAEQDQRLNRYLKDDRDRGFDLSRAPLMRLALFQTGDDVYEFVWSHHHVLLDGWSAHHVFKELLLLYEAYYKGQTPQLKPCCPYRDYIAWLVRQDVSRAEAYWRERLRGFKAPLSLGEEQTGVKVSGRERSYDETLISLSETTTATFRSFARRFGLTLNTAVQGAWALLLSRYSDRKDVVFGGIVSGRPPDLPGVETMVGLLVNTLPVRIEILPQETVLSWLKLIQQQQIEMREYEYSPLLQVQEWSEIPGGRPLFESILAFQNYPVETTAFEQSTTPGVANYRSIERNNYPLAIVTGGSARWVLKIIYDRSRFDAATITRMLEDFRDVIEQIILSPERRVGDLPFLMEAETEREPSLKSISSADELEQFNFQP